MNRLQFATLLSWAGDEGLQGRKRLQKVVFALQQIGCPLDSHFILHHYGPYSRDVADICDEMVAADLVEESQQMGSAQYVYKLSQRTSVLLAKTNVDDRLKSFKERAEDLLKEDLWTLELGSTILYYFGQNRDWDDSMGMACDFKEKPKSDKRSQLALEFAQNLVTSAANI